jgi:hypothetical protein
VYFRWIIHGTPVCAAPRTPNHKPPRGASGTSPFKPEAFALALTPAKKPVPGDKNLVKEPRMHVTAIELAAILCADFPSILPTIEVYRDSRSPAMKDLPLTPREKITDS